MWCISDVSQLHNLYYVSVFMFLVHTLIMIFAYDNKLICKGGVIKSRLKKEPVYCYFQFE